MTCIPLHSEKLLSFLPHSFRIVFANRWRRIVAVKRITMQVYRRYTSVGHVSLGIVATRCPRHIPRAIPWSEIMASITLGRSLINRAPWIVVLNVAGIIDTGYITTIIAGANPNKPIIWNDQEIIRMKCRICFVKDLCLEKNEE